MVSIDKELSEYFKAHLMLLELKIQLEWRGHFSVKIILRSNLKAESLNSILEKENKLVLINTDPSCTVYMNSKYYYDGYQDYSLMILHGSDLMKIVNKSLIKL